MKNNTYILGLSTFVINPSACLLKNGELLAFAEEERFVRLKNAKGMFPGNAINFCLEKAKITIDEVNEIAVGWNCNKYKFKFPFFMARSFIRYGLFSKGSSPGSALYELINQNPGYVKLRITTGLKSFGADRKIPPIKFYDHHLSHAASTYFSSGFNKSSILVIDGSGEENATSIFYGEGESIKKLMTINIPNSLGWFYAAMTSYLGFVPYQQEGYVMGLAPFGSRNTDVLTKMNNIIQISSNGIYKIDPHYTLLGKHTYSEYFSDKMVDLLGKPRVKGEQITKRHKNIAYVSQFLLEEAVLSLVKHATTLTGCNNLCLAGGVTLNCKMNGKIIQEKLVDKIFVQPVGSDAGAALGAAILASQNKNIKPIIDMKNALWGPSFSKEQVLAVLKNSGIKYSRPKNIERVAAKYLFKNKIVAWFNGSMEVGPRALGARSILANPTNPEIKDIVNNRVKHRDPWRPFCPSFTEEEAIKFYNSGKESQYMIIAYQINPKLGAKIPSVIHVDGSTRPQTVFKKHNPNFYKIIKELGKLTGTEAVLNTSFNIKGEPVVCTPQDALRCFFSTGVDVLIIEGFWIEK